MENSNKVTLKDVCKSFIKSKIVKRYAKNILIFILFFLLLEALMLLSFWLDAIGRGL